MKTQPKYILCCTLCGAEYEPDPFRLSCDEDHGPALLRAIYGKEQLEVREELPGIFRFLDWLPVERLLDVEGRPITYESENLACYLGLSHLFISFNGYWPERDARMVTCSFKELEAMSVLARVPEGHERSIVVASAGNTGRAFSYICSRNRIPLCLVIPENNLSAIWSPDGFHSSVRLVAASGNSDYFDAIRLAGHISHLAGFFPEGGAANVARRDGMGTTVLDAAVTLGRIPDHYFQAVGSGTGAIAAWEANLRLLEDGRFGSRRMKLHLSQNIPFTPMTDAWKVRSRDITLMSEAEAKERLRHVSAKVLSNRRPAYSIPGGLYDALVDSDGEMYSVTNAESERARALFKDLEGIDISPAAGIAAASLIRAVEAGVVGGRDYILLNITGGGYECVRSEFPLQHLDPDVAFGDQEIEPDLVAERMEKVLKAQSTGGSSMSVSSLPTGDLVAERINELSRNFWNSAVLRAGIKLGVFSLLEKQSLSAQEVAQHLKANSRFVHAFLEACAVLGLLEKEEEQFKNSAVSSAFLVLGKQEHVGDLVLHITNYWHSWGKLDCLIREGKTELPFENGFVDAATYWTDYIKGQHNRAAAGQASYLVQNFDLNGRRKLLDLGGGAASYSIALCGAYPQLEAFVVDRKEPLEIARTLVEEHNLRDRITLVQGDFCTLDLGTDNDVVLISGVVLIKSEEECRRLFRRAYDALLPGGLIIVQDFMRIDPSPRRRFLDTMMDLYVLVGFDPGSGDRCGEEVASWLRDTGFTNLRQIPLPTQLALITAEKSSATSLTHLSDISSKVLV